MCRLPRLRSGIREPECLTLERPLGRWIAEAGHAYAAWQPAFDSRFHKIGSKECQRDCHIDLTDAASFACGNHFDVYPSASRKLIEPASASCNGCD